MYFIMDTADERVGELETAEFEYADDLDAEVGQEP
jgi:hypothetical protein